jgi:pantoate--beta-alanine ligase
MIEVFKTENEFIDFHNQNKIQCQSIGFAPTMGNLHEGHISLLEKALQENDIGIISIFVNPTQFGAGEDLDLYPRTWKEDLKKIEGLAFKYSNKKFIIFYPESDKVIYPHKKETTYAHKKLNHILEGAVRSTHFDGVTTVVKRLFEIVKPNRAYFGKKDYQQQVIIKDMVKELNLPISIVAIPIFREQSGLAMSSRNNYLSHDEKEKALTLYQTLNEVAKTLSLGLKEARELISQKLKSDSRWNYLEVRTKDLEVATSDSSDFVILGNYQLGNTRLLDNIEIKLN